MILRACTKNVRRFDYFLQKLKTNLKNKIKVFKANCISSKIQEREKITIKTVLETVKGLTLDFEQELPIQKAKNMSGQASQKMMEEIKFVKV